MRNVHERLLPVPPEHLAAALDDIGCERDVLWPSPYWPTMVLDGPLAAGTPAGHGPIRYVVTQHEPGRCVEFRFAPDLGVDGYHRLEVLDADGRSCLVRHTMEGTLSGRMRVVWPVAVRWLHDCVLEQLLDNAERLATGSCAQPHRPGAWVRLLRAVAARPPRLVPLPAQAALVQAALPRVDFADAQRVVVPAGVSADPLDWLDAAFHDVPPGVRRLLELRNRLVPLIGVERGDASAFAVLGRTDDEALLGADAGHLDFRASVLVEPRRATTAVTLSTVVTVHNGRGRLYMSVVRLVHPLVVRAMLGRAARTMTASPARQASRVRVPA